MLLGCCALEGISGFPYDDEGYSEYVKTRWLRLKHQIDVSGSCIATVNREQLKAKRFLEKAGFKIIGRLRSEDDGRTLYIMAKGVTPISTPRTKRGRHAKHR